MPFGLKPNPNLYNKLAQQWEAEEANRVHDQAHGRHLICMRSYQWMILIFVLLVVFQMSILLWRRRLVNNRREARRQLYLHGGNDVEDVVVARLSWRQDVKVPIVEDVNER